MQMQLFSVDEETTNLREQRARFQQSCFARATELGYGYDWRMFQAWCNERQRNPLPASPESLAFYLTALLTAGHKVTTVRRRQCAIAHHHRILGYPSPVTEDVRRLISGATRQRCERPRQMRPLTIDQLRDIVGALTQVGTIKAIRDRAIMLIGFFSALRRSNLAELIMTDLEFSPKGLVIEVRKEKQDQTGRGRLIGIPPGKHELTCPLRALRCWLERRGPEPGPVFTRLDRARKGSEMPMDGECVERIVKRSVAAIGLDPRDRYGAHSLRAGFVTAAGEAGATDLLIAAQTGHRSPYVLRRYFRRSDVFKSNACTVLDL